MKRKISIGRVVVYVFLCLYALVVAAPLLLMIVTSLKENLEFMKAPLALPKGLNLSGYATVFSNEQFFRSILNSAIVAIVSLAVSLTVSILLSYALARYRGRWVRRWYMFFLVGMIVPIRLGVLFLNDMFNKLGLLNSLAGLICVYTAMSIPFSMFILTGYIKMIPAELDDAAFIDGCSTARMIPQIIVPLIKPALATVAIYNFLPIWNDMYFPLIFIFDNEKRTFMQYVTTFYGQYYTDYNLIFSALTFATMVSLIFYAFGSRSLVKGLTAGALKG
ncbi:MAG TPA: carbohydrate ABC transporter permease [Candidatus Pullichristensenella avicola]|nr:carbohydrate ABC transporter permease [Candidatus Pullichristensenella avicola]